MKNLEISTAELLNILAAMETAAHTYDAEANRTPLADIKRTLRTRARKTHVIASNLKNRALANVDFARQCRNAANV